jgi:hypothetical protein
MTKNALINALIAALYIVLVAFFMTSMETLPEPRGIVGPIAFLSLFVFSVLVMALTFFYQPIRMVLAGEKAEGVTLFVRTVAFFLLCTLVSLTLLIATGRLN